MQRKWMVYSAGKNRIFCFSCKHFSNVNAALPRLSDWYNASVTVRLAEQGSQIGHFMANFEKYGHF